MTNDKSVFRLIIFYILDEILLLFRQIYCCCDVVLVASLKIPSFSMDHGLDCFFLYRVAIFLRLRVNYSCLLAVVFV